MSTSGQVPEFDLQVVIVKRRDGTAAARLNGVNRSGQIVCLHAQEWPSGRPDAHQVDELAAEWSAELTLALMVRFGVQGVLGGG